MKAQQPKITVAIPTLGRNEVLTDTIRDVLKQKFDGFELVVVDQTTKHNSATEQQLAEFKKDARFRYFLVGPPSLPAARNYAIQKAQSDIILFIDDDVILPPNFIQYHFDAFAKDPEIVAVAGRVINKTDTQEETKEPLAFDHYGMGRNTFNCPISQYATSFPGGNVSVRKAAIEAVGGFDPGFWASAVREESDAAFRLVRAGGKIYYEAQASLIHLAAPSGGARVYTHPFDGRLFYRNDLLFALKTVRPRYMPISLAKRYRDYVLRGTNLTTKLHRSWLYMSGLAIALRFRLWPDRLVQKPVGGMEG